MTIKSIINRLRGRVDLPSLVKNGLTVGEDVFINFGCTIDRSFCWLITIGNRVTLAPNVHILAHDASTKRELGCTKMGKVIIGDDVFVGAGTVILPGVQIGDRVVIGAGSVVTKSIPGGSVAAGNPAKVICTYDAYMEKQKKLAGTMETFSAHPDAAERERIKAFLDENRIGFKV